MIEFTVNGQQYLAVEVNPNAKELKLYGRTVWETSNGYMLQSQAVLPTGNYEIVGLVKDLTFEEMASMNINDHQLTDNTLILKIKENE